MPAYEPILPLDVLSEQLGRPADQIVKLDANENPFGPLPTVGEVLARLDQVHVYPDPESRHLRRALGQYHDLAAETILAGAGADELIDLIMRLVIEPGDTIVNCPPTFGMYAFDADINAARTVNVPRRADWSLDVDAIEEAVGAHRPKLLFVATPNNPDGGVLTKPALSRLLRLPLLVVVDEAYVDFAPPGSSFIRLVAEHDNLIVLRTFSKWAGLAGLRVGYGVFPAALMPHLWKIKQPYNVSVAAQAAARASLEGTDELERRSERIVAERLRLAEELATIPWLVPYPSKANFILCRVRRRSAAALKQQLAADGILIRYFDKDGLRDHIRISVGTVAQNDRLLERLLEVS